MNYYLDTEFIEGTQSKKVLGFKIGETKPTIDLISIGVVAEDGRNYYAISKDFNLKEAWNRVQKTTNSNEPLTYWIRNNILLPIYISNIHGDRRNYEPFSYSTMKDLINEIGKTNKEIAQEVEAFIYAESINKYGVVKVRNSNSSPIPLDYCPIRFYGYYCSYDWVVFCQLYGIMMNIPKGFPFYCRDLKQIADEIWETTGKSTRFDSPKGEHNALADARWNRDFHNFLMSL